MAFSRRLVALLIWGFALPGIGMAVTAGAVESLEVAAPESEPAARPETATVQADMAPADAAVDAVPDEMASRTSLLGTEDMVRERIRAYRDAGVTSLRLQPMGRTAGEKLDTLERAIDLVREVDAERSVTGD